MKHMNICDWSKKIETVDDCEKFITEAYWFLIVMAGLTLILALVLKQLSYAFLDVVLMILIAIILKKYKSRSVATVMFIYSISICLITFGNKFNIPFAKEFGGGTNIFLAVIFVYVAFRTLQATYKLFQLKNFAVSWKNFIIKSIIFVILLLIFTFITIMVTVFVQNETLLTLMFLGALFLAMLISYAGFFPMSNKLKIKYEKIE